MRVSKLDRLELLINDTYQSDKPYTAQLPVFYELVAKYHQLRVQYDRERQEREL